MKKIINGKLYNTETAKELAFNAKGTNPRDFKYTSEALFQKENGEYFIYGVGGPMSKYAVPSGTVLMSGENIKPVTEYEAKKWAEENMSADDYIRIFGEVEE